MESGNAGDFWCIVEDITVPNMEARRGPRADWGITEGKGRRILNLTDNSEKPVGEWNTYQVVCKDDTVTIIVNGTEMNKVTGSNIRSGQIGIQSEGAGI